MIECQNALRAVAAYVAQNSDTFVTWGPLPTQEERRAQRSAIKALGRDIEALADGPVEGSTRGSFQRYLSRLHSLGFHPKGTLVSDVAQAFHHALDA